MTMSRVCMIEVDDWTRACSPRFGVPHLAEAVALCSMTRRVYEAERVTFGFGNVLLPNHFSLSLRFGVHPRTTLYHPCLGFIP